MLEIIDKLPDALYQLKALYYGGEAVPRPYVKCVMHFAEKSNIPVFQMYGPTECTTFATFYRVKNENKKYIPLGHPITGVNIHTLNKSLTPIKPGQQGELYISGKGIAKGYLNNLDLTKKKFLTLPTSEIKVYKTGDIAKYHKNGDIVFAGRTDDLVKIRGHRIQLSQIENMLLTHSLIKRAVVIIKKMGMIKY